MKLYEIDQAIMDLVDPETGEIADWEAFAQLQMERDRKIENVACWYKNLMADVNAIKAEEKALEERRKAIEQQANRKLEFLERALCGQKFQTARCSITFRKTTSVALSDEAAAIEWAKANGREDLLKITAPTINKTELAKVLKNKIAVPGAEISNGLSMGVK